MRRNHHLAWGLALTLGLSGAVGCSGGEDGPGHGGGSGGAGGAGGIGGGGGLPEGDCGLPANLEKRNELLAAQPALEVRAKSVIEAAATFASVAGDPEEICTVKLRFRDLNGDGALDAYEDWTLPAAARAADLLLRMEVEEKAGLLAHAPLSDGPTSADQEVAAATQALVAGGVRFGRTAAWNATPTQRATWANNLQALAEESALGIPFVLSADPMHSDGNGRSKARGFSAWPQELALGASRDPAAVENHGRVVAEELRAVGVRMFLGPSADLATDPRWFGSQFTFGEDGAAVAELVGAFVKGAQGDSLGGESVACVVGHFPGAGATKSGADGRLGTGRYLTYQGDAMDAHLHAFGTAFGAGVAGVMAGHGIPEQGDWQALGGLVDGASVEQVGVSFNGTMMNDVLRGHYGFQGLALSAWNALDDEGGAAQGAPWGVESSGLPERIALAIEAGVDQFAGLDQVESIVEAIEDGLVTDEQLDRSAGRALTLAFSLGLFENPYVDAEKAPSLTDTDAAKRAGWKAMGDGMVLLVNEEKPAGWLNGAGDGTQQADKGNAGNGTGLVLPAPPGEPYVAAGCAYYVMGNFDLDYVRSVSAGYGELTNDSVVLGGVPVSTAAERIARSDYVFIRLSSPCENDPESGALAHCTASLAYGEGGLAELAFARAAIDALPGSKTRIVVAIDGGRPSVTSEILAYDVSGLFQTWSVSDKVFLDVAFGITGSRGRLPVGLPLSDAAAAAQRPDRAGDGQHPTFVRGYGLDIQPF